MVIDTSVYKNNNHIINTSYEYESSNSDEKKINGRIKRQNINKNSSGDILYTYMYNKNDNIISIKKGDNEEEWKSYQYNSNNELISENITSEIDSININCTINYTYDEYGNIIRKEIIDNANESITQKEFEYTSNLSPYLLTKYNNKEIMYDLYGNINKYGIIYNNEVTEGYTYTYEMGLLRTVNKVGTDSNTYNYLYDSSGRRVQKIVGTGNTNAIKRYKYTYIGDMLINETLSNDGVGVIKEVEYLYDNNGLLYGLKYNGNNYYYVRDLTGCINQIINEAGNIVHEYLYDAYGNIIYQYGIMQGINSFIYKGYYYDEETQLFYCNSRYYSPELCRFISPDSIEYLDPESINGLNLYCYCLNNPIMYADPSGHSAILIGLIIGAIVGGTIGFGTAAYIDYQDDGQIFNGSVAWYDYLGSTVLGGAAGAAIGAGIGYIAPQIGGALSSFAAQEFTIGAGTYLAATGELAMAAGITFTGAQVIGAVGTLTLGGLMLYSEHTKGARRSTKGKHEEGQARKDRDQRGFIKKPPRSIIKKGKWAKAILWWLYYELFVEE